MLTLAMSTTGQTYGSRASELTGITQFIAASHQLREWWTAAAKWLRESRAGGSPSGRPALRGYLEAAVAIALITALKIVSGDWLGRDVPAVAYLGAVMFSAWRGGLGPGLTATVLSAVLSAYLFIAPYNDLGIGRPQHALQLAVTVAEGVVISVLTHLLHQARARFVAADREREYLASYAELRGAVIFEVNAAGHLTFANAAARRSFPDLVEHGARHPLAVGVGQLSVASSVYPLEVELEGRWFDELVCAVPGSDHVRVYASETTDKKRLEVELLQLQKMEAIGAFSAGIAHDFNNILGIILGCLQLARRELPAGHAAAQPLRDLKDATTRASELTKRLLGFARRQPLHLESVAVGTLLSDFGRLLERVVGEDIHLVLEPPGEAITIHADVPQIEQALLNLCVNARQAMPNGGELRIEARRTTALPEALRRTMTSAYVEISIRDTGVGMDSATRARIFEPFFTTKESGTGLGLATTYAVVASHRGTVTVDSTPGHGSTMRVFLPISEAAAKPTSTALPLAPRTTMPATILLAEDEPSLRALFVDALRAEGHDVIAVADGAAAVDAYDEARVSLVVLDLVMPGVGGVEARERIRARSPGARFLFVSGYAPTQSFIDEVERGAVTLLEKPFTPQQLVEAVGHALAGEAKGA